MENKIELRINDIVYVYIVTNISTSNSGATKYTIKQVVFNVLYSNFGFQINYNFSYFIENKEEKGNFKPRFSENIYSSIDEIKNIYQNYINQLHSDFKIKFDNDIWQLREIVGNDILNENIEIL